MSDASKMSASDIDMARIAGAMDQLRSKNPLVHNITNYVVMNVTANTLLAAGAAPAMVHSSEEVTEFLPLCQSLVINIGTVSPNWGTAMRMAAKSAADNSIPWVLDPVAAPISRFRSQLASDLVGVKPTVIRGNAGEIMALAGAHAVTRGVDSAFDAEGAVDVSVDFARSTGCIIFVTGPIDRITDGKVLIEVDSGHKMMTAITGTGCSLSALVGGYVGAHPENPLLGAAAASAVYGAAGKWAAQTARGPGSLQMGLFDALYALTATELGDYATVTARNVD